jgi:CBS domain-containing protein
VIARRNADAWAAQRFPCDLACLIISSMKAHDIMSRYPRTVSPDSDLALAISMMAWADIRHLPVVERGHLVGLLTEQGVIAYHAARGAIATTEPVALAMTSDPQTAGPDASVTELAGRMAEAKLTCLPIVDKGVLLGIVTTTDLLRAQVRSAMTPAPATPAAKKTVADVMTRDVLVVHPDDDLLAAAARMQQRHVRHLPVVDGAQRIVGMLSDRDVRAAVGDPAGVFERRSRPVALELLKVRDAMSQPAITTNADRPLDEVGRVFVSIAASALPVVDERGLLVGILSYVDVLRGLTELAGPPPAAP